MKSGLSGKYKSEYWAWHEMKKRCLKPENKSYPDYGGRGITVCQEWLDDFALFFDCLGAKPSPKHSIGRINNDGNYEPGNVRWMTREEQENNKRSSRFVVVNGERMTMTQAARMAGMSRNRLWTRLGAGGLSLEEALSRPLAEVGRRRRRIPKDVDPGLLVGPSGGMASLPPRLGLPGLPKVGNQ
jgi:hypothetical protein